MLQYKLNTNTNIIWGDDYIIVKGPKGSLIKRKSGFSLELHDGHIFLWSKESPEKEGAYLSWLEKLIIGVNKGYRQKLRLVGVGFRASLEEKTLVLKIGFSHPVRYLIPQDVSVMPSKGKGIMLLVKGLEYQRVKQIAYNIKNLRWPDIYKGKGIHYYKEKLKLKKGKRDKK